MVDHALLPRVPPTAEIWSKMVILISLRSSVVSGVSKKKFNIEMSPWKRLFASSSLVEQLWYNIVKFVDKESWKKYSGSSR